MSTPTPEMTARGLSDTDRMKLKLKAYEAQMKMLNSRIAQMQATLKTLGTTTQAKQLRAKYEAQIKTWQQNLAGVTQKRDTLQNQFYEKTGQYDKLLAGSQRDAFMAVTALFKSYGLESLAGKIFNYVKNGYSADTISILLQDTKEYKQRFAGNEARRKAGLAVLSPAEYLSTEAAYKQIMQAAGLPKGFYDSHKDFADFIGRNVSPSEIQQRVDLAVQATTLAPDAYKKALKQMGLSQGELVSYFLDEKRALPNLIKAAATAKIGAEALAQNLNFNQQYAESLAERGITAEQAAQGYSAIAEELGTLSTLGSIYGERWTQRSSERAMFEGSAEAIAKKKRLASQERGSFGGAVGGARGGLAQRGGQK